MAYLKALIQELDQRKVGKAVNSYAMGTGNWTDVINISDKGVLTGISQQMVGFKSKYPRNRFLGIYKSNNRWFCHLYRSWLLLGVY